MTGGTAPSPAVAVGKAWDRLLLQKVQRAHGEKHGKLMNQLRQLFDGLAEELSAHQKIEVKTRTR